MRVAWLLLLLALAAPAVQADGLERGLIVASLADLASTEYGLRACGTCYEGNPLLRGTGTRVLLKTAGTALVIAGTRRVERSKPRLAKGLRIGLIVLYSGAAVHNMRISRR
jgi:hypothetical protein